MDEESKTDHSRSWHYVTEKLPEPGQRVLSFSTSGGAYCGRYLSDGRWVSGTLELASTRIYAWMPAPEPPPLPEESA